MPKLTEGNNLLNIGPRRKLSEPKPDLIENIIGSFGKYQLLLCLTIFVSKLPVAFHQMAIIFLAPKVEYTCENSVSKECCPCPNPQYDKSVFTNTIIMQWNLICNKKWLSSLTQMLFQFGTLVGSLTFGMASDRFGRRKPMLIAVLIQITMGILASYVPNFWLFTFTRFLIGVSTGGSMVISFVIIMEFVGTKYRDVVSALYQAPFNIGHMLLAVFGYYLRDYSKFQLAISLFALVLLSYFCILPETARWLITVKHTDEAIHVLERVAKVNNRPTENIRKDVENYQQQLQQNQSKKGNILDLIRTPNLRKNILATSFNWLTCGFCFYGISQYVGQLSGNIFINVAASACVTLMGCFLSIPLMKAIGRRTIIILFQFICGICLIILAITPNSNYSVIFASIGVVASFIVFVVIYLYSIELFPTVVRNAAVGFSSMMARVGSMMAPFVIGLRDTPLWVPPLVFAIFPMVAGCLTFILPETKGFELMNTLEEGEQFGKKVTASC